VTLRFLLGLLMVAAYMAFVSLPGLLTAPFDARRRVVLAITRGWARLILWSAGIEVEVEGAQNVPGGPAVFAANHASALDIPVLFACLPADFRIIHKRSLYWTPVIGWYLYFGKHVGIDRQNPFRARQSLKAAAERIRAGLSVAAFPEGTRSRDGRVQAFKRGSFVLAQDAGVPVVPVSLVGVKALVPRGLAAIKPGRVSLKIHPPVATAGRLADEVAEEVRTIVRRGCGEGESAA
jgi:1-acyl-sn-glycerol-3-phosphate acyltransferase